ncbi:MAG: ABC transporter permease [Candidatus Acidiferrales bacterium]
MRWLLRLFHKSETEDHLNKELRFHIDQQIANNIAAGMSPEEARRRAQLEFGGLDRVKEEVRDTRWETHVENLARDFRYALRNLRKDRRFAFIAIFALALGIGASTVVFSVFYNLLFNAFSAKNASRLVVPVLQNADTAGQESAGVEHLTLRLADLDTIRNQNQVFENIVGYISAGGIVLANDGPQMYQFFASRVTSDAFEFYGVPPLRGRAILPEDGKPGAPPVFVMSYKTWKGIFNEDSKVLGKSFTVDGEPRTLVGVMPSRFQAFGPQEQIWIPITREAGAPRSDGEFPAEVLARLKPGVSLGTASADLDVIVKRLAALHPNEFPKHFTARVESAADSLVGPSGGGPTFHSDMKDLLYDLLAAVPMLLLIACGNVANLLLARASVREKEIAVRRALGATRGRLIRQLLVESFVLAASACVVGCVFAWFGVRVIASVLPQTVGASLGSRIGAETTLGPNAPVMFFAVCVTALTTLICGSAPALHLVRSDLQPGLTGASKGVNAGFRHGKLRAGLVISEVALSLVLLIGAGLMMRSLFLLTHVDLGFNPKNVLLIAFLPPPSHNRTPAVQRFASPQGRIVLREVVERLKALPGVADVAIEDTIPGYGPTRGPIVAVPGSPRSEEAGLLACDENFFHTVELRSIRGRWLSSDEVRNAQYVAVINQRLATDFFGDQNPIGRQIQVKHFVSPTLPPSDVEFQIIGVVRNVKSVGPQRPAIPLLFIPYTVRGGFALLLKTTVEPASLTRAVQEQVWAVDRDEIVAVSSPLTDFLQKNTYATPEFGLMIAAPLAGIGLLLVVIGIFSVMAYTVSLQTHEIGIRMALGAQQSSILKLFLAKGSRLIAAGIVIGLFAGYALTRFLASQIWGVSVTDPWTFASVVALIVLVGLAACLLPARRAAQVDPLVALHYE